MGEEIFLVLSYTEWRRWHTSPKHWYLLHCEHILMKYTKGQLEKLFYFAKIGS
jgi:hypothetical protein